MLTQPINWITVTKMDYSPKDKIYLLKVINLREDQIFAVSQVLDPDTHQPITGILNPKATITFLRGDAFFVAETEAEVMKKIWDERRKRREL